MPKIKARTMLEDQRDPQRPGKAVWDTRDRLEAAEARIAALEAENRWLRSLHSGGIHDRLLVAPDDPLAAGGLPVKRT